MTAWPSSADLESLFDSSFESDFSERVGGRPGIRTPTNQSSFSGRPNPNAATQGQVQSATRNLDAKIETLSNAVKALETRVNGIAADQQRIGAAVKKEIDERKKADDGIRADLQQTKTLSVLLPFMTNTTVEAYDTAVPPQKHQVVTKSDNSLSMLLPFLLLLTPSTGADASKGPLGDNTMMLMLAVILSGQK